MPRVTAANSRVSDRQTMLSGMGEGRATNLEALASALFDALAGSLWVQPHSAVIPDLAWSGPAQPLLVIDLHFSITRRDRLRGLRIPVPWSSLPQPWGQPCGTSSHDWAATIRMWIEEQVARGCDEWAVKDDDGYVAYFEIALTGLRVDQSRHRLAKHYPVTADRVSPAAESGE